MQLNLIMQLIKIFILKIRIGFYLAYTEAIYFWKQLNFFFLCTVLCTVVSTVYTLWEGKYVSIR